MPRLAFLTLEDRSGYVIDDALAVAELERRGVQVDEVPWRTPGVDWRAYDGVVIRTTWDYQRHLDGFLDLMDQIEGLSVPLANRSSLVRWNARKTYLADLERRGVQIVPTRWGRGMTAEDVLALPGRLGTQECVLKPVIGANADDAYRVSAATTGEQARAIAARYAEREWIAQPFVESILVDGEYSLFHFDGVLSHAVVKRPGPGDFRVQEEHGGLIEAWTADADATRTAAAILAALDEPPLQARTDLVRLARRQPRPDGARADRAGPLLQDARRRAAELRRYPRELALASSLTRAAPGSATIAVDR